MDTRAAVSSENDRYEKCSKTPLSFQILESRWHILRRDRDLSVNKAINSTQNRQTFPEQPTTVLPAIHNNDLARVKSNGV